MRYRVRHLYISPEEINASGDKGVELGEGWEPIASEVVPGGGLHLTIVKWGPERRSNPGNLDEDFS